MKTTLSHQIKTKGFSTIELLIAFSVGIIFLTAAMMVGFSDSTLAHQTSLDSGQAAVLGASLDKDAMSTSTNKLGNVIASLSKNWNAIITGDLTGYYKTAPTVTDISPCLKEVTNATTWGASGRSLTFGTALGSIDIAKALGRGGCDPTPPSSWKNPGSLSSYDPSKVTSANSGVEATGVEVKTINGRLYAFLTSQHATKDVPDFWIIDATDSNNPSYISSLDINNGVAWNKGGQKEGANDMVVVGNYAYVLRNYNVDQLQVINISNINSPTQVTPAISFESLGSRKVDKTGSDPQGEVIKYYNGRLYIGLNDTKGPELLVYDISTTPSVPTFVGAITNSFNHSISDIAINGNYAYLAIKPGTGSLAKNTKELMVANISTADPTEVTTAGFNAKEGKNSGDNDTQAATALYLIGSRLYLAREQVNDPQKDFYIFDVSNSGSPSVIGNGTNLNQPSNSSITGLLVTNKMAFLGLTKTPEFRVLDISDTTDIKNINKCSTFNFSASVSDIAYANNLIFVSVRSNDFLRIIHDDESTSCTK